MFLSTITNCIRNFWPGSLGMEKCKTTWHFLYGKMNAIVDLRGEHKKSTEDFNSSYELLHCKLDGNTKVMTDQQRRCANMWSSLTLKIKF